MAMRPAFLLGGKPRTTGATGRRQKNRPAVFKTEGEVGKKNRPHFYISIKLRRGEPGADKKNEPHTEAVLGRNSTFRVIPMPLARR